MFFSRIFYSSKAIRTKNASVRQYLDRQLNDEYAKLAREHNYRARSAFKLLEIQEKLKIFKEGDTVLDVGAAPGSWSQVAKQHIGSDGYVIGVDLQPIQPLEGVKFITRADIREVNVQQAILNCLEGRTIDCLISDMAPSPTGAKDVDHERIIDLCRTCLSLIQPDNNLVLPTSPTLTFVCKIWDGRLRKSFGEEVGLLFDQVKFIKPEASRSDSAEMFMIARKLNKQ